MEAWQLHQMQKLPLEVKVEKSLVRIREWYEGHDGNVYISFSGGKDSTVVLHLVRSLYPDVPAVFMDTGLEFPEIRSFVKSVDNVVWLRPKMSFKAVVEKYGYPVISKEQAQYIYQFRNTKSEKVRHTRWYGTEKGYFKISEKWKFLVDAPFKISDQCCYALKKGPAHRFEKDTGLRPYIGIMADESMKRAQDYLKHGCNAFETKRPVSRPIAFWKEQDVWDYLQTYNVPYSKIYDMGYTRTGCIFCMFGIHMEKEELNRFQRLKQTHPDLHRYCMTKLGLAEVLDYMGVDYGGLDDDTKEKTA